MKLFDNKIFVLIAIILIIILALVAVYFANSNEIADVVEEQIEPDIVEEGLFMGRTSREEDLLSDYDSIETNKIIMRSTYEEEVEVELKVGEVFKFKEDEYDYGYKEYEFEIIKVTDTSVTIISNKAISAVSDTGEAITNKQQMEFILNRNAITEYAMPRKEMLCAFYFYVG